MSFGGNAPKPPDPMKTALAQAKLNQSTAMQSQLMSMVNQVGPDGSLIYSQSGTTSYRDPFTGKVSQIPNYTQTTKLSDTQQRIKDQQDAAKSNLAGLLEKLTG